MLNGPITSDEVFFAFLELQTGKAAGLDGVVAEVLKEGGEGVQRAVFKLCKKAWEKEEIPDLWSKGVVCPLFKDGEERHTELPRDNTFKLRREDLCVCS